MSTKFYDAPEQQSIIKTQLVTKYFGAWSKNMLPRDPRHSQRIAYIDLFSGPGKFADGSPSTPLLILDSAIKDEALRTHLVTMFNDRNPKHAEQLEAAINALPGIETLTYRPEVSHTAVGSEMVEMLGSVKLVPTLFFIDPWGYKGLSLDLIGNAIKNWGCDCIFFFNYNRINSGIDNPFVVGPMNELFGAKRADELREQVRGATPNDRQTLIIDALTEALKAVGGTFVLPFEFKSSHGERTSHYVTFVSKDFLGYHLMKEVMFGLSSDDSEVRSFEYVPVKSPQLALELNLDEPYSIAALKEALARKCAGQAVEVRQVYKNHSVDTPYTLRNFKDAILQLEDEARVAVDIPPDKRVRKGEVTLGDKRTVTFLS